MVQPAVSCRPRYGCGWVWCGIRHHIRQNTTVEHLHCVSADAGLEVDTVQKLLVAAATSSLSSLDVSGKVAVPVVFRCKAYVSLSLELVYVTIATSRWCRQRHRKFALVDKATHVEHPTDCRLGW